MNRFPDENEERYTTEEAFASLLRRMTDIDVQEALAALEDHSSRCRSGEFLREAAKDLVSTIVANDIDGIEISEVRLEPGKIISITIGNQTFRFQSGRQIE